MLFPQQLMLLRNYTDDEENITSYCILFVYKFCRKTCKTQRTKLLEITGFSLLCHLGFCCCFFLNLSRAREVQKTRLIAIQNFMSVTSELSNEFSPCIL